MSHSPSKPKNARYLIHEMQTPAILVHSDVENGQTYWVAPQLDVEIAAKAKTLGERGTLTFRVPTANSLPGTVDALLDAVGRSKMLIAARTITDARVVKFVSALGEQPRCVPQFGRRLSGLPVI